MPKKVRGRNIFNSQSTEPYKLSRSKIEDFLRCPRCFYLDRRLGVSKPPQFPFSLNSTVDHLLKKEFDIHRTKGEPHALMKRYDIAAVPFQHENMDKWRQNFIGIQYHHQPTNFIVTGAVDDIWRNEKGELLVVDYKSTSKEGEVGIDEEWQSGYRNQIEVYQWLLRRLDFNVSNIGYFVYANGRRDREAFDGKLEFEVVIIPYEGNDGWVEDALVMAKKCLVSDKLPASSPDCDYCHYRQMAARLTGTGQD